MAGEFRELLAKEFAPYRVLSEAQLDALEAHYDLLCRWNKKINLCRFRDVKEAVQLHYCESLYVGLWVPNGAVRIVDVGSGAGFPGIPVGILRRDCDVDLLESDQRKAAFLREATHGRPNLHVLVARAESCGNRYDWMISRAVRAEDVRRAGLAPNCALLSSRPSGTRLPWGNGRFIESFHSSVD